MNSVVWFFVCLYSIPFVHAQSGINGRVQYNDTFISSLGRIDTRYILYFNTTESVYMLQKDTLASIENPPKKLLESNRDKATLPPFYYQNMQSKNILFNAKTALKQYLVEEDSLHFNWQINNQKKQIGDYTCQKATTTFRGRNYTAWFTERIPLSHGPRKFSGLPGLILEIYDDTGLFRASATKIEIPSKSNAADSIFAQIKIGNTIPHKDFLQKRCVDAKKLEQLVKSRQGRKYPGFKLNQVGGDDNLEIDTSTCED